MEVSCLSRYTFGICLAVHTAVRLVKCALRRPPQANYEVLEMQPIVGPDVNVRRVDFQSVIDNVNRASMAARQAQKLAAAAAKALSVLAMIW